MLFVEGSCLRFVECFLVYFFLLAPVLTFSLNDLNAATLPPVDVDALVPVAVEGFDFLKFSGFARGRIGHLDSVEL